MYQVTQSQTASNIKLIECVKKYKQLWDSSDPNYKNTVYVESGWRDVSKECNESVLDCKKRWRHLRSSLSRYLKSSKDVKNKNNKLVKPYYLLHHMEFLIPFTKSLDMVCKSETVKFDEEDDTGVENTAQENPGPSNQITYTLKENSDNTTVYATESISNHHDIGIEEEHMEEEEDVVYEYELTNNIQSPMKQESNHTSITKHINIIQQTPQPLQQSHSHPQQTITTQKQQSVSVIPVQLADDNSADINFFMAILPDVRAMTAEQKRKLRIGVLNLIDNILSGPKID